VAATFVNFSSAAVASTSVAITAPASVQANDLHLVFFGLPNTTETVTTPSGWTLEEIQTNTTDSTPFTLRCYKSTTVTGSQTFTKSGSAQATVVRVAYRDAGAVESSVGSVSTSTSASHVLATATTTINDSLVVACSFEDSASTSKTHTMPGPWVERADYLGNVNRMGMVAVYDMVKATAGTQGGTITSTAADHYATISVVIPPGGPTLKTGSDSHTFTESKNFSVTLPGPAESFALSETALISESKTESDTFVLTELAEISVVASSIEDITLTETVSGDVAHTQIDDHVLTESTSILQVLAIDTADTSFVLSEQPVEITETQFPTDVITLSEEAALTGLREIEVADGFGLTEIASGNVEHDRVDNLLLTETPQAFVPFTRGDEFFLTEDPATVSASLNAVENIVGFTEPPSSISVDAQRTDTLTLAETQDFIIVVFTGDSFGLSEQLNSITGTIGASDTFTLLVEFGDNSLTELPNYLFGTIRTVNTLTSEIRTDNTLQSELVTANTMRADLSTESIAGEVSQPGMV
jgi:hypothetical protein